jgi:hypothetical protein
MSSSTRYLVEACDDVDFLFCFHVQRLLSALASDFLTTNAKRLAVYNLGTDNMENTISTNVVIYCVRICFQGNVFIEPLPRNRQKNSSQYFYSLEVSTSVK